MARYTIELHDLIERGYHLALDNYPIFDEAHRNELNNKIIQHYWFWEIGFETPDRFNHYLNFTMNEIMPYYNELYKSVAINYNPLFADYLTTDTASRDATLTAGGRQKLDKTGEWQGEKFDANKDHVDYSHLDDAKHEGYVEKYGKSGDHVIDTAQKQVEDLDKVTWAKDLKTTDMNDDWQATHHLTEGITEHQTSDRDRTQETTRHLDTTGQRDLTSHRVEGYSDLPQGGVQTTVTTAPDGTVTTTTKGYLTTQTTNDLSEHENTKGTEDETTNVVEHEDITADKQTDRNLDENSDQKEQIYGTVNDDHDGTETNDNTIDTTFHEAKKWTEQGWNEHEKDNAQQTDTTQAGNQTEQSNRQSRREIGSLMTESDSKASKTDRDIRIVMAGRRSTPPADLIMKFREAIRNVDYEIIERLSELFMGVY